MSRAQDTALLANAFTSALAFGARGDGINDDTAELQAAINACDKLYIPAGSYKITTALTVPSGKTIIGDGISNTVILVYGANALNITGDYVNVSNLELRSYNVGGTVDPRASTAISCNGTDPAHIDYFTGRDLYLRGWDICVDWKYTWSSILDSVTTINCNNGVRLFGQSVNNAISNCRLLANGGNASINTVKDGVVQGEGLMVSNTLMAQGDYGIRSTGFLSMSVVGCVIDLVVNTPVYLTDVFGFSVSNSWLYSEASYGMQLGNSGGALALGASITDCYISGAGSEFKGVYVGATAKGVSIRGGYIKAGTTGTARCVISDGNGVSVAGVRFDNSSSNQSVYLTGTDNSVTGCTGDKTAPQYAAAQPARGEVKASIVFNGSTGALVRAFNATVVRNSTGNYTLTFPVALGSADYNVQFTASAGGNAALGYTVDSATASAMTFHITNQAAAAVDSVRVNVLITD